MPFEPLYLMAEDKIADDIPWKYTCCSQQGKNRKNNSWKAISFCQKILLAHTKKLC
jgi:hypothetical protein